MTDTERPWTRNLPARAAARQDPRYREVLAEVQAYELPTGRRLLGADAEALATRIMCTIRAMEAQQ
jgi:hypothetical protein